MDSIKITHDHTRLNGHTCAVLAKLAYKPVYKVEQELYHLGNLFFYDEGDTQAFIFVTPTAVFVAFRGTQSLEDFYTDIKIRKEQDGDFEVHRGFKAGLDQIWHKRGMLARISQYAPGRRVYLLGHSLGGGLATIASSRLLSLEIDHLVYTYGCPRVFTNKSARLYNKSMLADNHRYVNNNDIVTRIPPRVIDNSHVGTCHYFIESGEQRDGLSQWERFLDRVNGRLLDIGEMGTDGLKDHGSTEYIRITC